jgi:hypothetical protein
LGRPTRAMVGSMRVRDDFPDESPGCRSMVAESRL